MREQEQVAYDEGVSVLYRDTSLVVFIFINSIYAGKQVPSRSGQHGGGLGSVRRF
jgi:hypothetical protein